MHRLNLQRHFSPDFEGKSLNIAGGEYVIGQLWREGSQGRFHWLHNVKSRLALHAVQIRNEYFRDPIVAERASRTKAEMGAKLRTDLMRRGEDVVVRLMRAIDVDGGVVEVHEIAEDRSRQDPVKSAYSMLASGQSERAAVELQQILQGAPFDTDALALLAACYAQRGNADLAVATIDRAVGVEPNLSSYRVQQLQYCMGSRGAGGAVALFENFREAFPREHDCDLLGVQLGAPKDAAWAVSADGRRIATAHAGGASIHVTESGAMVRQMATTAAPSLIALSPKGEVMAAAIAGAVWGWKINGGEPWRSAPLPDAIAALQLSADGRYALAIAAASGPVTRSGAAYRLLRWRIGETTGPVTVDLGRRLQPPNLGCLVSSDGSGLNLSGQRIDIDAAAASAPQRADAAHGPCAAIEGGSLTAVIEDTRVIVSDAPTGQAIARLDHPAPVRLAALSPAGRLAATLDEAGSVRLWAVDSVSLIEQMCARTLRPLSADVRVRYLPASAARDVCGHERTAESAKQ